MKTLKQPPLSVSTKRENPKLQFFWYVCYCFFSFLWISFFCFCFVSGGGYLAAVCSSRPHEILHDFHWRWSNTFTLYSITTSIVVSLLTFCVVQRCYILYYFRLYNLKLYLMEMYVRLSHIRNSLLHLLYKFSIHFVWIFFHSCGVRYYLMFSLMVSCFFVY